MRKAVPFLLVVALTLAVTSCGMAEKGKSQNEAAAQEPVKPETRAFEEARSTSEVSAEDTKSEPSEGSGVLVAYFSVPEDVDTSGVDTVAGASIVVRDGEKLGNTEYVARLIQETVGGDLFRIETVEAYPLDHDPLVDQAADEQDENARPQLASHVEDFEQYETVLLGYPNWWGDMPMPVYSFLEEYDFEGKTIIPFITHGGSRASGTVGTISKLEPGAQVLQDALVISRNDVADSEETVTTWAEGLGIKN